MALEKHVELLGRVPIFHGLQIEQLASIAVRGKKSFFEPGKPVVKRQTKGQAAYLILSGEAVTRPPKDSPIKSEKLGEGVLIGEMLMLTETVYGIDIIAETRVRALSLERADLYTVMEEDPSIAHYFAERITERLLYFARDLRRADARFAMLEASLQDTIASAG